MKKIFTFLFALNAIIINAQVSVQQDSVYKEYDTNEQDLALHNFHSTTNPTITVAWKVLSINAPANWVQDFYVCDAEQCWDNTKNTNQYDLIDNKQKSLDVHFQNNGNAGDATAKLLLWQVSDSANTVKTITYTVHVKEAQDSTDTGTAIQDAVATLGLSIYPNPVVNQLNINNIDASVIEKIEVFNIIGKQVYTKENLNTSETIHFENQTKGIYILKFTDNKQNHYSFNFIKK